MKRNLKNKTIVITGASSGIGAATARACAKAGMNVALAGRNKKRLEQVAQEVRNLRGRSLEITCDVTINEQLDNLFKKTWQEFGRVDVIYANAGVGLSGAVLETSQQQHREIFDINYFGTINTIKGGIDYLRNTNNGLKHILISSSALSEISIKNVGAYCATKAAQKSIAGAMRGELKSENIKVTSVHPVGTRTPFFETSATRSGKEYTGGNTPKIFMKTPEKVANAIVKCLKKPTPQVWTSRAARYGLALVNTFPKLESVVRKLK